MLDEVGECVLEEIVRSLFEGNSSEAVEETLVSLLQLLREGLIGVVGPGGHVHEDSKR